MTFGGSRKGHRLCPQPSGEAPAEFRLQLRRENHFIAAGEEGRQFGIDLGAMSPHRLAVAAMAQAVAIARLAAALSNRANFTTPSLPGGRLALQCAAKCLHPRDHAPFTALAAVWISIEVDSPLSRGRCWRKINFPGGDKSSNPA
jgi:hypothetical protein